MSERKDIDNLLTDVLAEPGDSDTRERLLAHTLGAVRRRRVLRRVRFGSVLFLIAAICVVTWRALMPPMPALVNTAQPYILVYTQPLPASAYVQTQPLSPDSVLLSAPSNAILSFATSARGHSYSEIDDATLLSLAAPEKAILVRLAPHSAELVFVPDHNQENGASEPLN